ncbi:Parathyroid hormone/parathyroid hormone-related peptide receptor [Lamellibrachia satsuma]|nr:Parathyroid hormone/parathyroid hormone-related peptide receptor [Lamellibrachia satsuma]
MLSSRTRENCPHKRVIKDVMLCILMTLVSGVVSTAAEEATNSTRQCRDRSGYWSKQEFFIRSSMDCFVYLFPGRPLPSVDLDITPINGSNGPTVTNVTSQGLRSSMCEVLTTDECRRWTECRSAAERCCQKQMAAESRTSGHCPSTWDGYACWDETYPGVERHANCPGFLPHAIPSGMAEKICTASGTWYIDPSSGLEWTRYTTCLDLDNAKFRILISVTCHVISVVALLPSIVIFLVYKSLRVQNRIRLHVQLFLAILLNSFVTILWQIVVVYAHIANWQDESTMEQNTVGCKMLNALTRYTHSVVYMWMFSEGFYLHRLITKAFKPPTNLKAFYAISWGFPLIPSSIYSLLRVVYFDESCWIRNFSWFEWLYYAPDIFCLTANLAFLVNILRIIVTQIQALPNEPSNYRRALRTTFILIPLFGLQSFFIMYRPSYKQAGAREYEYVATAVKGLQGFVVALVFCLVNIEVLTLVRRSLGCHSSLPTPCRGGRSNQYSMVASRTVVTSFPASERSPYLAVRTASSPSRAITTAAPHFASQPFWTDAAMLIENNITEKERQRREWQLTDIRKMSQTLPSNLPRLTFVDTNGPPSTASEFCIDAAAI